MASRKVTKKESETKYINKVNKYFHLSNSGLSAIVDVTDKNARFPHVKIQLRTGTFGVMNSVLELIACNHTEHFMGVDELLELSEFFAQAAKMTNEIETLRHQKDVEHWKNLYDNVGQEQDKTVGFGTIEERKKRFKGLLNQEIKKLQKQNLQKDKLESVVNSFSNDVTEFNKIFYRKQESCSDSEAYSE